MRYASSKLQSRGWARHASRGVTLVEMVIAVFIATLVMYGAVTVMVTLFHSQRQQAAGLGDLFQATMLSSNFANQVRNASYGSDGSYPITEAGATEFVFFTGYGTQGTIDRIRYYLDQASGTLYEGVIAPSGSPPAYDAGTERVYAVQSDVSTTSGAVFHYYDGNYAGTTTPLSQPVNITAVKFVALDMNIENQAAATGTFPIDAGATVRVLKTNLGS